MSIFKLILCATNAVDTNLPFTTREKVRSAHNDQQIVNILRNCLSIIRLYNFR